MKESRKKEQYEYRNTFNIILIFKTSRVELCKFFILKIIHTTMFKDKKSVIIKV